MTFRDDTTALHARLAALEQELASTRGLTERNRLLEQENAQLTAELAETKRKLRKLRKRFEPPRPDPPLPAPGQAASGDARFLPLTFRWRDAGGEHQETIRRDIIKIGKLGSSHLRIADESVSRMHAVIEVQNEQAVIIDLGSSEGTRVNGKKVNKATLKDGDMLTLGRVDVIIGIRF